MDYSTKMVGDYQYLIVGGTTKAATTSLFTYLADHPSICCASYKETRFFLDKSYPLPSKYRYTGDIEEYNLLFSHCNNTQIRLESTPDYLYCSSARETIATFLPNIKLVFSLREPISRLVSWYRFAKQNGNLEQSRNFEEYVDQLFLLLDSKENIRRDPNRSPTKQIVPDDSKDEVNNKQAQEQYMLTLEQGCYATYLRQYMDRFGSNKIYTVFYEDLAQDPITVLNELCDFSGIDFGFYKEYLFKVTNRTESMRSSEFHRIYRDVRFEVRKWTHNKPIIHNSLRVIRKAIEPIYLRLNTQSEENIIISEKTQKRLVDYYKQDVNELTELIGKRPPWNLFSAAE